jgi:ubiquinone biosynthesis protein
MALAVTHLWRLARAGLTLARHDALMPPEQIAQLPWFARLGLRIAKLGAGPSNADAQTRVSAALSKLGPSYIKLGQFLATRPDLVGAHRAFELRALQDKLPPFPLDAARRIVEANLGGKLEDHFAEFSAPIAAASIAQVHRARTIEGRDVAVKILRPGVKRRFASDIESFTFAARLAERFNEPVRRLHPVAAVETLDVSMRLELDLRMEASAMAEMRANTKDDPGFRVPDVDWQRTSKQVLTLEWIDGTPMNDVAALRARGLDLVALGDTVIQSFLRHAIRDGFFHADMHQGNLFVDPAGTLIAVDFGIMGRLGPKERMFLAEILYGFITRDYARVSRVHFEAGYVPASQDEHNFAQALRAIGEPIMDKSASEISMAKLLTQLFEVTGQFDMEMQPQLLLLQKTMVVVEGVARTLNPKLNMWATAEPVVRSWIERKLGPIGKLEGVAEGALQMGSVLANLPDMLSEAQRATAMLAGMAKEGGVKLDRETLAALATEQARQTRWQRYAMAAGAAALVVIAWNVVF